jgi:hypothetical protein
MPNQKRKRKKKNNMSTLTELAQLSTQMAAVDISEKKLEKTKAKIRVIVAEMSVEEHMHVAIDILGTLRERDGEKFTAVIYAVTSSMIENLINSL